MLPSFVVHFFIHLFIHSFVNEHGQTQAMCWREKNKLAALKELETPFQESVIKKEKKLLCIYVLFVP